MSAEQALKRLREGNGRFVAGRQEHHHIGAAYRNGLVNGQEPFAVIVGCSDSRVPPDIIFDQGIGDLFVIRVAGNIITSCLVGSVEYAAEHLGTRLIVVMGHTHCGAVTAAVREIRDRRQSESMNLHCIFERIQSCMEPKPGGEAERDEEAVIAQVTRANVRASIRQLEEESAILRYLEETDGLRIVGAEYSLETGVVEFDDE